LRIAPRGIELIDVSINIFSTHLLGYPPLIS
jgi:hypothetical protein